MACRKALVSNAHQQLFSPCQFRFNTFEKDGRMDEKLDCKENTVKEEIS